MPEIRDRWSLILGQDAAIELRHFIVGILIEIGEDEARDAVFAADYMVQRGVRSASQIITALYEALPEPQRVKVFAALP